RHAAETTGIPYMLSFRGTDFTLETFADELAANRLAAEGAKICTFNNEEARRLGASLFAIRCPTFAIPNSFDWSEFSKLPVALPSRTHPILGMCANLWRVAGTDQLLTAFEQLYPEVQTLLLVGEFWKQEALYFQKRLSSLACRDHIVITGWVPHESVMGYLRSCDVLVFPSVADGSPNKVLEGLASGVPVIAAAVGGIRDMITDGVDGFLLSDPHPNAIVEKVQYVLQHQSLASECAHRAQDRIAREFTHEREYAQWKDCYRILLQ
ncbi:MAG: glycosyltransferase family 4 protein, partial [Patescibacteria group bacterium]